MILVVTDWTLRSFNFFINLWLFFAIRRSGQTMKIYVFLVIYFIISHDILAGLVGIFHDVPSYYHNDSILANLPMLSGTCVVIMSLQWFFQLLFLPAFSLIHFCALFFPLTFRRLINTRTIVYIILSLYTLTAMLTVPLFTSYVAFIYHPDGNYWGTDLTKPYSALFSTVNNGIQVVCLTVMVTCNILIIYKLALYRRKSATTNEIMIVSTTRGSGHEHTSTENSFQNRKFVVSPETRLAVSYIHLSGCFFTKTLAYNLILGNSANPLLAAVYLVTHYLNSFKWILYWCIMFLAVLTVIDWILKGFNLLVNIWLFLSIYKSGEVTKIYVFLLLYFLVAHDILAGFIVFLHDIPSYFQDDSILIGWPILYAIVVIILCVQWWYHLLFLPVFSLMHFCALFFPTTFRRITMRFMWWTVGFLYLGTAIISAPLFTPYCGFVYHPDGKYWSSDYTKPYDGFYLAMNRWVQAFALVVMVSTNFVISAKLYILRVKNKIQIQMTVHSFSRHQASGETNLADVETRNQHQPKRNRFYIAPEVRLAASYLLLSFCFFASTLAFEFLLGTEDPFLKIVYMTTRYMNNFKWIVYCLGNKKTKKSFMSIFSFDHGWPH